MSHSIERNLGPQGVVNPPRKADEQAAAAPPAGGAAPTGVRPVAAAVDALNAQRGAPTAFGLPPVAPAAPAAPVPAYGETFGSKSYVKDAGDPAMLALMTKAIAAHPELAAGPLGQGVGQGQVGPQQVKALQTFLQGKGYSVGASGVDGKFGPNTHAALAGLLNGQPPAAAAQGTESGAKPADKPSAKPVDPAGDKPTKADPGSKTAVYDVSSATVTLPDGTVLEAHSGRGSAQDDPNSSNQRNRGTTPTGVYKLTPREARFHGTAALRLTPISGNQHGRDGFLAHNYMLGPSGESHGCVVFKNYPAFLKAYNSGQINQIKIVE